ncbi:hypothetical protein DSY2163 [Desulfitobacterium hafniense Y51]|uniref:Uncharacterized protein n=1 Tax=Desulfitobacterium hafniense (strain Y51) TaxID=138119 RepID=Q24VJ0_DESHY|nr:hypothetical protein DSY2163 [Desulfitobacterium hafniense Y51]
MSFWLTPDVSDSSFWVNPFFLRVSRTLFIYSSPRKLFHIEAKKSFYLDRSLEKDLPLVHQEHARGLVLSPIRFSFLILVQSCLFLIGGSLSERIIPLELSLIFSWLFSLDSFASP